MKQLAEPARLDERVVGLVPTMGALHEGHFSLIRAAKQQCSPVVVSIFVNPKQFGPSEDFQKYPRHLEADCAALEKLGVDYLFAPSSEEMYPQDFRTSVIVGGLSDRLEGRLRPAHFVGVTTIVLKLFNVVQPRLAFFGRKDAQQVRIIRQMARDLNLETEIIVCPIIREEDGLALSSRNVYLNADERRAATALHRALEALNAEVAAGQCDSARLVITMRAVLDAEPLVKTEYVELVDDQNLEPVAALRKNCYALLAARVGGTRLIDNALIEQVGESFRVTI